MSNPPTTQTTAAFDLIVSLRGGLPERCDFCEQPYTEARHPIPEEAGEWTCSECWARWQKEEAEATK